MVVLSVNGQRYPVIRLAKIAESIAEEFDGVSAGFSITPNGELTAQIDVGDAWEADIKKHPIPDEYFGLTNTEIKAAARQYQREKEAKEQQERQERKRQEEAKEKEEVRKRARIREAKWEAAERAELARLQEKYATLRQLGTTPTR